VLQETFNWTQLCLIAGLTLHRVYFRVYEGSITGEGAAEFIKDLLRQGRGNRLVIWGGAAIPVKALLTASDGRPRLERLGAYTLGFNLVRSRVGICPSWNGDSGVYTKEWGRWRSNAYLAYTKQHKKHKQQLFTKISSALTNL